MHTQRNLVVLSASWYDEKNTKGLSSMSILTQSSNKSLWRGLEYYEQGKVMRAEIIDDNTVYGEVSGSDGAIYHVTLDLSKPRLSNCDCPHASGRQIICKHMVALYFAAFPEITATFIAENGNIEDEMARRKEKRRTDIRRSASRLSKREIIDALEECIIELEKLTNRKWFF